MEGFILYVILFIIGLISGGSIMFLAARKMISESAPAECNCVSSSNVTTISTTVSNEPRVSNKCLEKLCPYPISDCRICTSDQIDRIKSFMKYKGYDKSCTSTMCQKNTPFKCPKDCTKCCTKSEHDDQLKQIEKELNSEIFKESGTGSGNWYAPVTSKLSDIKGTLSDAKSQLTSMSDTMKNFNI